MQPCRKGCVARLQKVPFVAGQVTAVHLPAPASAIKNKHTALLASIALCSKGKLPLTCMYMVAVAHDHMFTYICFVQPLCTTHDIMSVNGALVLFILVTNPFKRRTPVINPPPCCYLRTALGNRIWSTDHQMKAVSYL